MLIVFLFALWHNRSHHHSPVNLTGCNNSVSRILCYQCCKMLQQTFIIFYCSVHFILFYVTCVGQTATNPNPKILRVLATTQCKTAADVSCAWDCDCMLTLSDSRGVLVRTKHADGNLFIHCLLSTLNQAALRLLLQQHAHQLHRTKLHSKGMATGQAL